MCAAQKRLAMMMMMMILLVMVMTVIRSYENLLVMTM
jgi:hypothetical protein